MEQPSVDDLRRLLTRVRRRWITATSMRACARAAGVALAVLVVVLVTDRLLDPADVTIVVLAVAACVLAVTFAVRTLWPLRHSPSDTQVARFIEEQCPELEDRLASATEVARDGETSALGKLVLVDAAARARSVDPNKVVASDHVRRSILKGVAAAAAFLVVFAAGSGPVSRIARTAWLYAFPYSATLEIEPGDVRVVAGEPVTIVARLAGTFGAPARTPPSVRVTNVDGSDHTLEMEATAEGYRAVMPSVEADITYHVTAATLVSETYHVTALFPPKVAQVDVAYQYPSFTQLPPRVETDSGDIYAPEGTEVTLTVHTDKTVSRGGLLLEAGGRMPLLPMADGTLQAAFTVSDDDTYRIAVVDDDGLSSSADIDYFIRTVLDRPPDVEITRPVGDRDITPLEEAVIEARALDDFGLERFDLVYAVVGEPGRTVSFLSGGPTRDATGRYTVHGEDLDLAPGDFISYYARALDTNTGDDAGEVRSDIYFLQVRPFDQEFEGAQSQTSSSMDAGEIGNLAEVQKEIIVATWRLDSQTPSEQRTADIDAVADAQEELRWATSRMAQRLLSRGRLTSPQSRNRSSPEVQAMRDAVAAMAEAEIGLRSDETSRAVPLEMEALNQLLKAEAEVRRRQVSTQQNGGGRRGENQAREDLSALFDQELRRDQETNYESRPSSPEEENDGESEAQRRLRELAERQQDLSREQAELAGREDEIEAEEIRRQLDRLTREQNELRAELEALARDLETPQPNADGQQQAGAGEISERMRRAMSELRRGDLSQAARESQQAADRLQELQRQTEGRSGDGGSAALGELQRAAQRLAGLQRQIASDTRQSDPGAAGDEGRARVAARGDQLADDVDSLEQRMGALVPQTSDIAREALNDASDELRARDVAGETRELADRLRRPNRSSRAGDSESGDEVAAIADETDALAEALDEVAERLAAGEQQSAAAQRLAEALGDTQALRESLDAIEAQLTQPTDGDGVSGADTPGASQDADRTGAVGQPGTDTQAADGSRRPTPIGSSTNGELAALQDRLMRQLAESPELLERLNRQRPNATQDLEEWAQSWQSGAAPGTEGYKQDLAAWESLRDDLEVALEAYAAARSRDLRAEEIGDRLAVGSSEQMPEAYRRLVERYYRSLATQSQRP